MKLLATTLFSLVAVGNLTGNDALIRRSGRYIVSLRLPPAGLVAGEEVQIEFRVADATQVDPIMGPVPIVRARIETSIDMPEMPSMPKLIETAHPEGVPGDYGIHPTFPHGGAYRLRMNVQPLGGEGVQFEFTLDVQDAGAEKRRKPPPPRFQLELKTDPKTPKAGEVTMLRFEVRERDNPNTYSDFETVHEKLMHLIIVSKDLAYFRHEHPNLTSGGTFVVEHAFPDAGEYHLFADIAPRGAGTQLMFTKLKVSGKAGRRLTANNDVSLQAQVGGTTVQIATSEQPVEPNKTKVIPVLFRDTNDGRAVADLEKYLGAMAHLILIHEDALTFVHSHPDEREGAATMAGTVPFLVRLPKPGIYHAWLQFIRTGTLHTAQFKIRAGQP